MDSLPMLAATAGAFLLAGFVKGVIGLGLPTVAIGLLGLMMTPAQAAAILVAPSLVTNVWQAAVGGGLLPLVRRMWPMLAASASAPSSARLAAARQQRPGDGLARLGAGDLCGAWPDQNGFHRLAARRTLARLADGRADRRDHGRDRHLRAAGHALSARAAIRPASDWCRCSACRSRCRPSRSARRSMHAGEMGMSLAGAGRWWRSRPYLSACGLGKWCAARCAQKTFRLWFFIGLLVLGAHLALRGAIVID